MDGIFFYKVDEYETPGFYLPRPRLIGLYEYNQAQLVPAKRLKYLNELKCRNYPLDLDEKKESIVLAESLQPRTKLHIHLSYAMSPAATIANANDGIEFTPVYTYRRVLTQIMESYISRHNFAVDVSYCNGSLYMAGVKTVLPMNVQAHHLGLEQLLFSDSPQESPEKNNSLGSNISLTALHRTTLGKYSLIYTGGVQGIIAEEEFHKFDDLEALNQLRFVLSKQTLYTNKRDWKFLTYWLQGYLANVDDIYIAYKNPKGVVVGQLEHVKVSNIPKKCRSWKPEICAGVLHEFLERVEQLMANVNSLDTVYTIYFTARERKFYYKKHEGKTKKSFIPKHYANFVAENMD